jgi:hypothetical protein
MDGTWLAHSRDFLSRLRLPALRPPKNRYVPDFSISGTGNEYSPSQMPENGDLQHYFWNVVIAAGTSLKLNRRSGPGNQHLMIPVMPD